MGETTAVSGKWRDAMRPEVEKAAEVLERVEWVLHIQYEKTRDGQVESFRRRFERAADALIGVFDELFPPADDDPDENVAGR